MCIDFCDRFSRCISGTLQSWESKWWRHWATVEIATRWLTLTSFIRTRQAEKRRMTHRTIRILKCKYHPVFVVAADCATGTVLLINDSWPVTLLSCTAKRQHLGKLWRASGNLKVFDNIILYFSYRFDDQMISRLYLMKHPTFISSYFKVKHFVC